MCLPSEESFGCISYSCFLCPGYGFTPTNLLTQPLRSMPCPFSLKCSFTMFSRKQVTARAPSAGAFPLSPRALVPFFPPSVLASSTIMGRSDASKMAESSRSNSVAGPVRCDRVVGQWMSCSRRKSARPKKKRGTFRTSEDKRGGVQERFMLNFTAEEVRLSEVATVPPRP